MVHSKLFLDSSTLHFCWMVVIAMRPLYERCMYVFVSMAPRSIYGNNGSCSACTVYCQMYCQVYCQVLIYCFMCNLRRKIRNIERLPYQKNRHEPNKLNRHALYLCFVVFSSYLFWTSSSLDVPAGVTQEEGHTGFLIHLPSAVHAFLFLARRVQPFLSLVDREVEFCRCIFARGKGRNTFELMTVS